MTPRTFTRAPDQRKKRVRVLAFAKVNLNSLSQTLSINETLTAVHSFGSTVPVTNSITFSQTLSYQKNKARSISDFLTFTDSTTHDQRLATTTTTTSISCTILSRTPTIVQPLNLFDCFNYTSTHHTAIYSRSLPQSLLFSQTITQFKISANTILRSISQTFSPAQTLSQTKGNVYSKSISQTFSPTQNVSQTKGNVYPKSLSDVLSLTQNVSQTKGNVYPRSLSQTFSLTQTLSQTKGGVYPRSLSDTLSLTQALSQTKGNIYPRSLSDSLTVSQTLSQYIAAPNLTVQSLSDTLVIVDNIDKTLGSMVVESLSHSLSFSQTLVEFVVRYRSLSATLSFSQTLSKKKIATKKIKDALPYTEAITRSLQLHRVSSDILTFKDPYYTKMLGGQLIDIPIIIPTPIFSRLKQYKFIKFQSYGNTITLPAPQYENIYKTNATVSVKRTMTGGIRTYIKTNVEKSLKYNFVVTEKKKSELFSFLSAHNTDAILITDWKNDLYAAYLVTNPLSANFSGNDKVELELEFQGLKVT